MPVATTLAALFLVLAGYGFEVTLVPFHMWAPDTYQGAPTPIAGFLSVGPKAAGLAVLLHPLAVAFPQNLWHVAESFSVLGGGGTRSAGALMAGRRGTCRR